MLPTDSKLRDITISPNKLDFGHSGSEKQTVSISNRTSQKVTAIWMISGETSGALKRREKECRGACPVCRMRRVSLRPFAFT